ncbi:MAG: carboxypeptidase-like regulatory domain-containing protein [Planctomycetota bacterium]
MSLGEVRHTDAAGRVAFELAPRHRVTTAAGDRVGVAVRHPGYAESEVHYAPFPERGGRAFRVELLHGAFRFRGRVVDGAGAPLRARVSLGDPKAPLVARADGVELRGLSRTLPTDAAGAFAFPSQPPNRRLPLRVEAPGMAPYAGWVQGRPDEDFFRELVLDAGASVSGTAPPGALVFVESGPLGKRHHVRRARADQRGAFRLDGLAPGPVWLLAFDARAGDRIAHRTAELVVGEELRWSPQLEPTAGLAVRVLDETDAPLAGAWVFAHAARDATTWSRALAAGRDGRARFRQAPPGVPLRVDVYRNEADFRGEGRRAATAGALRVGGDEAVVRVLEPADRTVLRGTVAPPSGVPLPTSRLYVCEVDAPYNYPVELAPGSGGFVSRPTAPGAYDLVAELDGHGACRLARIALPADGAEPLRIQLPPLTPVRPAWSAAEPVDAWEVVQLDRLPGGPRIRAVAHGRGAPPDELLLFPGSYRATLISSGRLDRRVALEVP